MQTLGQGKTRASCPGRATSTPLACPTSRLSGKGGLASSPSSSWLLLICSWQPRDPVPSDQVCPAWQQQRLQKAELRWQEGGTGSVPSSLGDPGQVHAPSGPQHLRPSVKVLRPQWPGAVCWGMRWGRGHAEGSQKLPLSSNQISLQLSHVLGLQGMLYLVF